MTIFFFYELTVKSTHPFQDFFTVVLICKEERDFPAGVTVDSIDLSRKNWNKLQKNRINSSIDSWTFVHYYSSKKIVKEFEKITFIDTCKIN